jgi:hypothetical protein
MGIQWECCSCQHLQPKGLDGLVQTAVAAGEGDRFFGVPLQPMGGCQLHTLVSTDGEAICKAGCGFNQILTHSWGFRHGRTTATPDASTPGGSRYRCSQIGSYARAQDLLRQGHTYLVSNGDGEACESLRH